MKSSIIATASLFLAFALVGCDRSSAPKVEQEPTLKAGKTKANWKSVTLHFEGFTKSKSGST
jgi:PBP1b-binding outer membrane lipoprotein LpoB